MLNKSSAFVMLLSIVTSLASPLASATSNPPAEFPEKSKLNEDIITFHKYLLSGDGEFVSALLRHKSSDFVDRVLAPDTINHGALAIAAIRGHTEVMRALLDFVLENTRYAKSIFAGISKIIRLRIVHSSNIDVLRLLLDFATTNPEFRDLIFESQDTTHYLLRLALHAENVETLRALLEFAAANSDHANIILPPAPAMGSLLGRAARNGNIPALRVMLESPFWATFLDYFRLALPRDQETARSVWMVLLEYAPYLAAEEERFLDTGLLESAVMEMDRDRVRALLGQGAELEAGGELLNAMLRNRRNFEREQFRSFAAILESLRPELMPPQVQARAQSLFEQALLNNPPLEEQPLAQTNPTLDKIIAAIRSRLIPNLQTLSLEAFGRGIRSLGQYGGRGQFASEGVAYNAISRVHEVPSLNQENPRIGQLPFEDGILPGARLFASGILPYLIYFYFNQHGVLPGGNNK